MVRQLADNPRCETPSLPAPERSYLFLGTTLGLIFGGLEFRVWGLGFRD